MVGQRRQRGALMPGTPGQRASRRVGDWPVGASRRRQLAAGHAAQVWETARGGVVSRGQGLWTEVGGDPVAFGGQVDLAFLATVAGHLRRCERCWREWADGETPVELLSAAVLKVPAGAVFRAVVTEIKAGRAAQRRRVASTRGRGRTR